MFTFFNESISKASKTNKKWNIGYLTTILLNKLKHLLFFQYMLKKHSIFLTYSAFTWKELISSKLISEIFVRIPQKKANK